MGKIVDYTPTTAPSIYAGDVADLIAAGEGKAMTITVAADMPKENGKSDNSVANSKRAFQTAARDAGYTARVVDTTTDGVAVDLTFILRPLVTKGKSSPEQETATDAEYADEPETPKNKK